MIRYAVSTWIAEHLPTEQAIEVLADGGFQSVELSGGVSALVAAWEKDPVGVRHRLSAVGIDVPSIHCPRAGRFLDVADDDERRASIAANVDYFHWMQACGIPEIVIHPTSSVDVTTPQKRQACWQRIMESLRVLAGESDRIGVRMAVENLGRDERPGSTMADLLDMIGGLGDHVGICYDVGHAEQAGLHLIGELRTATDAGKLFSLHIHDVDPSGTDHFIPGEGRIDYDAFLSELAASRSGALRTLEVKPPEADVPGRLRQVAAVRDAWQSR